MGADLKDEAGQANKPSNFFDVQEANKRLGSAFCSFKYPCIAELSSPKIELQNPAVGMEAVAEFCCSVVGKGMRVWVDLDEGLPINFMTKFLQEMLPVCACCTECLPGAGSWDNTQREMLSLQNKVL